MIKLKIITPLGLYKEGEVEAVHVTTVDGETTILSNHMPIVAMLKTCKCTCLLYTSLNILGDLALPVSLSLRLFGNLLAGTIITGLVYTLMESLMPFGVLGLSFTPFLHAYFDIFSGLIQTYIFFTLASFFLSESYADEEE